MTAPRLRPLASLQTDKLSTGCLNLDAALGGGIPCGSLTELTGEAAASKTQLSLQLLLTAQLSRAYGGLEGSAVYVYTEGEPAMRRLHQLARWLHLRYPPDALAGLPDPTANIFVEKGVEDGAELLRRLQRLRGLLDQQRKAAARAAAAGSAAGSSATGAAGGDSAAASGCSRPVRLLIVDSVAHVFRDMGDSVGVGELAGRTQALFKLSALLRRYADEYGLAVLLVNQVVDSVQADQGTSAALLRPAAAAGAAARGHTGGLRLMSLGREVAPALGLAWANCVNTRLFLSRCAAADGASPARYHGAPSAAAAAAAAAGDGAAGGGPPALRKLQVVWAPHLPQAECYYVVEASGVRGLAPEELEQHGAAAAAAAHAAWEQQQREQEAAAAAAWEQQQQQGWGQHHHHQGQQGGQPQPHQQEQQGWEQQQWQQAAPPQQQQGWEQQQWQQTAPPQQRQVREQQQWQQQAAPPPQQQGWEQRVASPAQQGAWQQPQPQQQQEWLEQQWHGSGQSCQQRGCSGSPQQQQQQRRPLQPLPPQHHYSGW